MQTIKTILLLLIFTLATHANIPSQITNNDQHQPLVVEYEDGNTITYSYDGVGNITQIETPTQTISKTYDALNRLKTVTDAQGTVTYDYDAIGRQTQVTYPNGVTTSYSYDSRNRVTNIEHKSSNGDTLQSFAYSYDAVGNRTKVVEHSGRTVEYSYNEANQLTKEVVTNDPNGNNTTTTFTYDAVGNLATKTIDGTSEEYAYNENDQLIQKGSITYTYDSNGNLISDGTSTYSYDDKNRLIKVVTPNDTVEYTYDANDNRIAKTTSNGTTTYLVDANTPFAKVITESKDDGTTIAYTYGNALLSDGEHSFLTDALGSTRALVDSAGNITDSYAYSPYGALLEHFGSADNAFLFTGEQRDSETGNYYLRARYYSPTTTRFLSRDTYDGKLIDPLSQNHYLYAGGNPVMYVDPSGHMTMMSLSSSLELMSSLNNLGMRAIYLIDMMYKAESLVGLINLSYSIREVLGRATQVADNPRTGIPNIDYIEALRSASYNIPAAIATGIGNWSLGYQRSRRRGRKLKSFLLYMPLVSSGIGGEISIPTPAKISFGRYKVPLKIVFGGLRRASGTLIGLGVNMGGNRQLIRMDYHRYNSGHGGSSGLKSDEISVWRDGNFHYHVRKW